MQSIAEEVVSSSGGGGKYITSGFSAYVGHSAIGVGSINTNNISFETTMCIVGIVDSYNIVSSNYLSKIHTEASGISDIYLQIWDPHESTIEDVGAMIVF